MLRPTSAFDEPPFYHSPMETHRIDPAQADPSLGDVWSQARREYLSGVTAASICQRYGMSLASFRAHARAGGWRRIDRSDCDSPPEPGEYHLDDDVSFSTLADQAFLNIRRAIGAGRAAEAASWMRLFDKFADRARSEIMSNLPDYPPPEAAESPAGPLFLTAVDVIAKAPVSSELDETPDISPENLDSLDSVFSESSPEVEPSDDPAESAATASETLDDVQRAALMLLRSRRLEHNLGVSDIDEQLNALGPSS